MPSLEERVSKLEAKSDNGKAWLLDPGGRNVIVTDRYYKNHLSPVWQRMAAPYNGPTPRFELDDLPAQLAAARKRLEQNNGKS